MEPFVKLTSLEKAKLLHELFPDEIAKILPFILQECYRITNDANKFRDEWKQQELPYSADIWIHKAEEVKKRLILQGELIITNSDWFATQLFDQHYELFILQYLQDYTLDCKNESFVKISEGLFGI